MVNHTLVYNSKEEKFICLKCPDHCTVCAAKDLKAQCGACSDGYFVADTNECQPCAWGCQRCLGPSLKECLAVELGYFYNRKIKNLEICSPGCGYCNSNGDCLACSQNYLGTEIKSKETTGNSTVTKVYKCTPCSDPNCMHCAVDRFGAEVCTYCKRDAGFDPLTRRCAPCESGCSSCSSNSKLCNFCNQGFEKNIQTGKCEEVKIPYCMATDSTKQKCTWCKAGFMVDHQSNQSCLTCATANPRCSSCRSKAPNETLSFESPSNVVCTGCLQHFNLNRTTNNCDYCGDTCLYCSNPKFCNLCQTGYTSKNGVCVQSVSKNCNYVGFDDLCASCKDGYYLDMSTHQCARCHESCLTCIAEGEEYCSLCPLAAFGLFPDTKAKPNAAQYFHRTLKCVDKCPEDTHKADPSSQSCVELSQQEIDSRPKVKYILKRYSGNVTIDSLSRDAMEFKLTVSNYIQKDINDQEAWAKSNPEKAKGYSKMCRYRGKLEERLSLTRESYYACACMKNVYGSLCEIEKDLYELIQAFVAGFVYDMMYFTTTADEEKFYKILTNLAFKGLSLKSLNSLTFTAHEFMEKRFHLKVSPQYQYQFFLAADSLLAAHLEEKERILNSLNNEKNDVDSEVVVTAINQELFNTIRYITRVAVVSAPDSQYFSNSLGTNFKIALKMPKSDTFKPGSKDTLTVETNTVQLGKKPSKYSISLSNQVLDKNYEAYKIVGFVYNPDLFNANEDKIMFVSELVSLSIVHKNSQDDRGVTGSSDTDLLRIWFPIHEQPIDEKDQKNFKCVKVKFGAHSNTADRVSVTDYGMSSEDKTPLAYCEFKQYEIGDVYYGVEYLSTSKNTAHAGIYRSAMEDKDIFPIATFKTPMLPSNSVIVIANALLSALGLISVFAC